MRLVGRPRQVCSLQCSLLDGLDLLVDESSVGLTKLCDRISHIRNVGESLVR